MVDARGDEASKRGLRAHPHGGAATAVHRRQGRGAEQLLQKCCVDFAEPGAHGAGRVSTARWVLTWKRVDEGNDSNPRYKAKARLVLRGFQDPDLAHLDKAAPTGSRNAKMIQLMACVNQNWQLLCGDVRAAFLSGEKFDS